MTHRIENILLLAALLHLGCGDQPEEPSTDAPAEVASTSIQSAKRNPKIPVEVSYPIIRDEEEYNAFSKKRMVDVKLNMKVLEEVLHEIALEVKSQETRQYERTFVFYYLPETVPGAPVEPWATTHFNPTLDVQILGLSPDAEKTLRNHPLKRGDELIGAWICDAQFIGHRATIFREGDILKLEELSPGGGAFVSDLTEIPSPTGRRFKKNGSSDQYEIGPGGTLRIYGYENKVILAAQPMEQ